MTSTYFDITAHLASVLAYTPACYRTLNAIYDAAPARYSDALDDAGRRDDPVLAKGRAEHHVMAWRAMGILLHGDPQDVQRLLRSANRRMYDYVLSKRGTSVRFGDVSHTIKDRHDMDVVRDQLILLISICKVVDVQFDDPEVMRMLADYLMGQDDGQHQRAEINRAEIVKVFGNDVIVGASALYDAACDHGTKDELDVLHIAADMTGLELGDYTRGIKLSAADLSDAVDQRPAYSRALIMLLCRAIQQDRAFCLDLARRDKAVEIAHMQEAMRDATQQMQFAVGQRDQLASRLDQANATIAELTRKLDAAEAELEERSGDAQELAALREALYAAQTDAPMPIEDNIRSVPDGVLSLGGTEAWARQMRSELPQVVFLPADVSWTDAQVRDAAELWVQASYYSHSQYYRAMRLARQYKVPVYYYSGTSVGRCVEEIRTKR